MPNSNDYNHPLVGTPDDDQLIALSNTDFVDGKEGDDTLILDRTGSGASFTYDMTAAATAGGTVTGGIQVQNVENVVLTTGGGADTLMSSDPSQNFYFDARGGSDKVILDYSGQGSEVTVLPDGPVHGMTVSVGGNIVGHAANIDSVQIKGGSAHDTLTDMRGGNDKLWGNGGDDYLVTTGGADMLDGGLGVDAAGIVRNTSTMSFVVNGAAAGTLLGTTLADGTQLKNIETLVVFMGSGNDELHGTATDDVLSGGSGNDQIWGAAGDDLLTGDAGDDWINGGAGNDKVYGGQGIDTLIGGLGDDTYHVGDTADVVKEGNNGGTDVVYSNANYSIAGQYVENLVLTDSALNGTGNGLGNHISGTNGDNSLWGMGGVDRLYAAGGNDSLDGGAGADVMFGGSGDDIYFVDNAGDVVSEHRTGSVDDGGTDKVVASVDTELWAFVENLALAGYQAIDGSGNSMNNGITGNANANRLEGRDGNDTLRGMHGNDTLIGGDGDDVFWFEAAGAANGLDQVGDFEAGDRLAFNASDYGFSADHVLASDELSMTGHASGTNAQFIYNANNNTLYWDADGTGGQNAQAIAVFLNGASVHTGDFVFL